LEVKYGPYSGTRSNTPRRGSRRHIRAGQWRIGAACKLIEIANSVEAVQDGRIYIEPINRPFLDQGCR
jgi:hypothetical protein